MKDSNVYFALVILMQALRKLSRILGFRWGLSSSDPENLCPGIQTCGTEKAHEPCWSIPYSGLVLSSELFCSLGAAKAVTGRGVVVIEFKNEGVGVTRLTVVASGGGCIGLPQQFRDISPAEAIHPESRAC